MLSKVIDGIRTTLVAFERMGWDIIKNLALIDFSRLQTDAITAVDHGLRWLHTVKCHQRRSNVLPAFACVQMWGQSKNLALLDFSSVRMQTSV